MNNKFGYKTKPIEMKFTNDPKTVHDIDLFAHGEMNYLYKDVVPLPNGETLALMFPRGAKPIIPGGEYSKTFIKKWYWIWSMYDRIISSLTAKFKWNNLPDELKPWYIEDILNKEGQGAFVKINNKYIFTCFDTIKSNIYDEPIEIKINLKNKNFTERKFKEKDFTIIKNNPKGTSTFNDIIQYLEAQYVTLESLRRNTFTSQPKGVFLQNAYTEENGKLKPIAMSLNAVAEGSDTFYSLSFAEAELRTQQKLVSEKSIKDFFIPIEFKDRTEQLIKEYNFWDNQTKLQIGLNVTMSQDKKEKLINAEIEIQNSDAQDILKNKIDIRKEACNEINKKFNLNISIEEKTNETLEMIEEKQLNNETNYKTRKNKGDKNV